MSWNILFAGEGGQGVQVISDIICDAARRRGWYVSQIPNFGLEQRGGVSLSFVKISDRKIVYPKFMAPQVTVVLSAGARERIEMYEPGEKIFSFEEYTPFLKENVVPGVSHNMFYLGLLTHWLSEKEVIVYEDVFSLMEEKFGTKNNWIENQKAFALGFNQ